MSYPLLLHDTHRRQTEDFEPFGEWIVPWRYQDFKTEYDIMRGGAGLRDFSAYATLTASGPDSAAFLQRLLSNDVAALKPGSGCRAFLLDANAKLRSDLIVLRRADAEFWLLEDASRARQTLERLERYHFSEDVTLENRERAHAVFCFHGPKIIDVLTRFLGRLVVIPAPYDHAEIRYEGVPLVLARRPAAGVEILCLAPETHATALWDILLRKAGAFGLQPLGWEAWNAARIENGDPWMGIDMDESNLLPETGLETSAASDSKGCYIGQEIVARMQTYGSANKRLTGLLLREGYAARAGTLLYHRGVEAGRVTSACFSPRLGRSIALAHVKRPHYDPGTLLETEGGDAAAEVAPLPLIEDD